MSQRAAGEILKPYSVGGSSRLGRWERGGLEGHCGLIQPASSAKQTAQQGHEGGADQRHTAAGHELFYPQIGVGKRLDGGRRRVKKYLWSFLRTAPAGQVRL